MSHGLIIRNGSAAVLLDSSQFTIRTVYSELITVPSGGITVSIPGVTTGNSVAWCNYDGNVNPQVTSIPYYEVIDGGVRIEWPVNFNSVTLRLYVSGLA